MDKILSARIDESVIQQVGLLSRKLHTSQKAIIDAAGVLYRKWHSDYGIDANDAMLAVTVIQTGGRIYTLNRKHFPMSEINVQRERYIWFRGW